MGLDIDAYQKIEFVREYDCNNDHEDGEANLYPFPEDEELAKRADGIRDGIYRTSGEWTRFRAGSYSGYNEWRRRLSVAVHGVDPQVIWDAADDWRGKPFFELIHFADNEGVIGPQTSAKLAKDFSAFDPSGQEEWFVRLFNNFKSAFEIAAGTGVVKFH